MNLIRDPHTHTMTIKIIRNTKDLHDEPQQT